MEKITPVKIVLGSLESLYRVYWGEEDWNYSGVTASDEMDAFKWAMSYDGQFRANQKQDERMWRERGEDNPG